MAATDVLVVGAGPTGLTVATLLARAGVPFRIVDAKAGPVEESRAVVVHAKTLELFARLGLAESALADGQRTGAIQMRAGDGPVREVSFFEAGDDDRTPYPFALTFEQSKTERLLLRALEEAGGAVAWRTELAGLTTDAAGARAVLRGPDGAEEEVRAGWVVGADGAHSRVRRALGLGFAGETYEQTLFLADVDLDWDRPAGEAYAELTSIGFLLFFPMPGRRRFRLLGTLPPDLAATAAITAEQVQAILDDHSVARPLITQTRWTSVYRTHHRMTRRFRVGRVFLAGDAAHIHSPAGGQGMNTGIGDGYNLGWKLALVAGGGAREDVLDSYEAERMPFARAILNGSDRGFRLVDTTDPVWQRLKFFAVPRFFRLLSASSPLRRRMFWLLSQLWTGYRGSPAVAETGPVGRLPRAGDRAPFGAFERGPDAGRTIFDVLTGTDHHLLLFDGLRPDPGLTGAADRAISALLGRFAAPIRLHRVGAAQARLQALYGADAPTVVLVRPDGHVAYRGDAADVAALVRYLDRVFVERPPAAALPGWMTRAAETGADVDADASGALVAAGEGRMG